jgi:hypothetical protein
MMISKVAFWLSGQWGGGQQIYRTVNEYLGNLDIKSRIANLHRIKIDYVGLSDSKRRISNMFRTFNEKLGLLDVKSRTCGFYRTFIDYVGCLDVKSRVTSLHRLIKDNIGLMSIENKVKSLHRTIIDGVGLLETKIKSSNKNIIEYIELKDMFSTFKGVVGQVIYRMVTEVIGLSESVKGTWNVIWRKIRGYFIEDYKKWKKKRLLRLLRHYILLESEDEEDMVNEL